MAGGRLRQRGGGPSWDSSWIKEALRGDHACQGSGSDGVVPFGARAGFAFRAQMSVAGRGRGRLKGKTRRTCAIWQLHFRHFQNLFSD